jgi:hypothetical protein
LSYVAFWAVRLDRIARTMGALCGARTTAMSFRVP